jgi:WD repeat-containing protein 1 (actin-interacting protein 1)
VFTTAVAYDSTSNSLVTASYDAKITRWNEATGESVWSSGAGHTNSVQALAVQGDQLISGGMDDSVQFANLADLTYTGNKIATDGPVSSVAASSSSQLVAATTNKSIYIIQGNQVVSNTPVSYGPRAVAISPDNTTVAVGGDDRKLHIYNLSGNSLSEKSTHDFNGDVENIDYAANGQLIAVADRERFIKVFKTDSFEQVYQSRVHTARVHGLAFSPDSARIATVSQDAQLVVHPLDGGARQTISM